MRRLPGYVERVELMRQKGPAFRLRQYASKVLGDMQLTNEVNSLRPPYVLHSCPPPSCLPPSCLPPSCLPPSRPPTLLPSYPLIYYACCHIG